MKLFIGTPMYGGNCKTSYVQSLLDLILQLKATEGYEVEWSFIYNESLITRARNTVVDNFLKSDADALLFIDSDHGFSASDIIKMIESGKDLIGAVYPMKALNWERTVDAANLGYPDIEYYSGFFAANMLPGTVNFSILEPLEVESVGTGMMFITRKVFEEMAPICQKYARHSQGSGEISFTDDPYIEFFKTSIDERGVLLSEDYEFCRMWRSLGNSVYAAPWVTITHAGEYVFKGSFARTLMYLNNKENKN
jgi:hypothetical protein